MDSIEKAYQRDTASDHVYRHLRQAILGRSLADGERLIETTLAKQLGVSRTPMREALSRLQADGLIGTNGTSNGLVVLNARDNVQEIVVLRRSLEAGAAFLAASRATKSQVRSLREFQRMARELLENSGTTAQLLEVDRDFHRTLGQASGSQRIDRLVTHQYSTFVEALPDAILDSSHLDLHDRIVSSIDSGDAVAAESYAHQCADSAI